MKSLRHRCYIVAAWLQVKTTAGVALTLGRRGQRGGEGVATARHQPKPDPISQRPSNNKSSSHNLATSANAQTAVRELANFDIRLPEASLKIVSFMLPHLDFHANKRIVDEVAVVPSKRLRNKIFSFTIHLTTRVQRRPVRGISFKLQEEEREREDNYVLEGFALDPLCWP